MSFLIYIAYNYNVYKNVKNYVVLCLICLQILVPFIHGHEFGRDSYNERIFHFHTDEISNVNNGNAVSSQTHVSENQIIGAITTVASGIKASLTDNFADHIALLAILFSFALLVFNFKSRLVPPHFQTANYQRIAYSLHPSRAPPR